MFSKTGEIRRDEACLDYAGSDVILYPCHGSKGWCRHTGCFVRLILAGNQYWQYDHASATLKHGASRKCLAISGKSRAQSGSHSTGHLQPRKTNF